MIIIFLFAFAAALGLIAFVGAKASKKARKAKMKQDIELLREIASESEKKVR